MAAIPEDYQDDFAVLHARLGAVTTMNALLLGGAPASDDSRDALLAALEFELLTLESAVDAAQAAIDAIQAA